jgi:hypothetical protein
LFSALVDLVRIIESAVSKKFTEKSTAIHFVVSFLFFKYVCVALFNPAKYQLAQPGNE